MPLYVENASLSRPPGPQIYIVLQSPLYSTLTVFYCHSLTMYWEYNIRRARMSSRSLCGSIHRLAARVQFFVPRVWRYSVMLSKHQCSRKGSHITPMQLISSAPPRAPTPTTTVPCPAPLTLATRCRRHAPNGDKNLGVTAGTVCVRIVQERRTL